jgi:hypothetical protein
MNIQEKFKTATVRHEAGSFIEKDVKGYHSYYANTETEEMTNSWNFPHKLLTNDGFRYCLVTASRAYIAIDEDAYGQPVIETWEIYSHIGRS